MVSFWLRGDLVNVDDPAFLYFLFFLFRSGSITQTCETRPCGILDYSRFGVQERSNSSFISQNRQQVVYLDLTALYLEPLDLFPLTTRAGIELAAAFLIVLFLELPASEIANTADRDGLPLNCTLDDFCALILSYQPSFSRPFILTLFKYFYIPVIGTLRVVWYKKIARGTSTSFFGLCRAPR